MTCEGSIQGTLRRLITPNRQALGCIDPWRQRKEQHFDINGMISGLHFTHLCKTNRSEWVYLLSHPQLFISPFITGEPGLRSRYRDLGYAVEVSEFEFPLRQQILLFSKTSRWTVGSTQPPVLSGSIAARVWRWQLASTAEVHISGDIPLLPQYTIITF
jgi:hypothetical protein